jgi:EAL domain-containing protein (putative c-di-GMP-specific phosphodiesterase class I)
MAPRRSTAASVVGDSCQARTGDELLGTPAAPDRSMIIRLVMIDDHELVLQSVVRYLNDQPDMTVVASAATVEEGIQAVRDHVPDLVILDYQLPDGDGASAARVIRSAWPLIRVVMLTGSGDDLAAFEAERAGCAGFIDKSKPPSELIATIRRVNAGLHDLPEGQLDRLPRPDDLVVYYQPIVDLPTASVVGYEALVRWQHPTRGLVQPGEFIGLAERSSLIVDIGERVRRDACRTAAGFAARSAPGQPTRFMSINLSGRELLLPDLPDRMSRVLDEAGLAAGDVVVEVTESFFIGDADENVRQLVQLKDLGVRIALDDFGTGYSSLNYLRRFPIDIIKLDKGFVDELPDGERGRRLVDAVGHLAGDLGAVAEAEGIETAEQAACLISLGWQFGQGYYYGRPADAATTEQRYERSAPNYPVTPVR